MNSTAKNEDDIPMVRIPKGGERNINFSTDVEDQYFDRSSEPGRASNWSTRSRTNDLCMVVMLRVSPGSLRKFSI